MKILFLTDNFPPEVNAPATRTYEHCREWMRLGAEVTVITCVPNFPQGKVFEGYRNKLIQKEIVDGIKVVRVWSYITANNGFLKRVIDFLSFSFTSFLLLLFKNRDYDIIIATSPQFFTGLTAMLVSKIKRVPWVFEVRDLWPEGIILLKRNTFLYKFLEWIEKKYYQSAKGIVTVTESFKLDIQKRFSFPDNKFSIIYNGANNKLFKEKSKDNELLKELELENKFIIGYAGTLGVSHSLDFILSTLPEIYRINKNIYFLFIGSGAMEVKMKKIIKENNLVNVKILPPVEKQKISTYISIFDVGLVPLKKDPAYLKVIPSKIFELASMKKPILLGVEGETKSIIEKYNAGITYMPEDSSDFVNKVLYLFDNKNNLKKFKKGLAKLSEDFDRTILANQMFNFLENILSENNSN